jgi:hypothetical protein
MENSFIVTLNMWTTKIHDAIDRSVRTNHTVVDAQCVQAIVDGLRASSDQKSQRNLNGFVYDASFQLHHKKPGTSVMQRDLKKVGIGGKTTQKTLCVTFAAAIIQWMLAAGWVSPIRIRTYRSKDRHDCNWRPVD